MVWLRWWQQQREVERGLQQIERHAQAAREPRECELRTCGLAAAGAHVHIAPGVARLSEAELDVGETQWEHDDNGWHPKVIRRQRLRWRGGR